MDFYSLNLAGLLLLCLVLFLSQRSAGAKPQPGPKPKKTQRKQKPKSATSSLLSSSSSSSSSSPPPPSSAGGSEAEGTKRNGKLTAFLLAYTLATASDWLQGAHIAALYADEHRVSPRAISLLFATGFGTGALSAARIGRWADARGRKRACLAFCGVYAASCALTATGAVPILGLEKWRMGWLVLGRMLGGVGTSLLFVAFESWVVGFLGAKGERGEELRRVLGVMSGLNSVVAVVCGVVSEWLVTTTGTKKAPFLAAAGVLVPAAAVIWTCWDENYGRQDSAAAPNTTPGAAAHTPSRAWTVLTRPRILALGAASTAFEGSMYLFVFFWAPALRLAAARDAVAPSPSGLPYGVIFASFMASTLASSLVFNTLTRRRLPPARLLVAILAVSAGCFCLLFSATTAASFSLVPASHAAFWLFCLFEAAVGLYWPCAGALKGALIEDGVRAQVYGALRVPVNVFVVASLLGMMRMQGGDDAGAAAHGKVFGGCAALLAATAGVVWAALGGGEV
ncbi:hypothetical protein VTJ83DRAFT_5547 [Remersonia thermophila]|uniref:Molybdate-anion transporter n=1 Tax=Remersonia thermophila TaxID=72144 RepID=A0ABR4D779_9PEZI